MSTSNEPSDNLVVIGRSGRSYGVRGWFHLQSFTDPSDNILNYKTWVLLTESQQLTCSVEKIRPHGDHFVAKLSGYGTPESVRFLSTANIAVPRNDLPTCDDDDVYWTDLIGLQATLPNGTPLGTVDHLFATGANDVLVIKQDQDQDLLVPYLDDVVLSCNPQKGILVLDWDPEERLSGNSN